MPNFLDLITFYDKNGEPQIAASESDIASLIEHIGRVAATKQDVINEKLSLSYHDDSVSFGFNSDGRAGVFLSSSSSTGSEGPLTIKNNNGSMVLEANNVIAGKSNVSIKCQERTYLNIDANDKDSTYTVDCSGTWTFPDGELKMGDSIVATRSWVQQNVSVEIGDSISVGTLELSGYESYAQITSNQEMNIGAGSIKLESSSGSKFLVDNYVDLDTPYKFVITTGDYTIFGDTPQSLYYTVITSDKDKFEIASDRYGDDSQNRGNNKIAFNENGIDIINSISGYASGNDNNKTRNNVNIKQTGGYGGINIASEGSYYTYANMTCDKGANSFGINIKSEYGMRSLSSKVGSNGMTITDGTSGSYNGTTFTGNVKFTGNVEGISGGSGGTEYYVFGVSTLPTTYVLDNETVKSDEHAYFKIIVPSNIEFPTNNPNSDGALLNDWWDVVKNHMDMGQSFAEFENSMEYSNAISDNHTLSAVASTLSLVHKFFYNYLSTYSYWNNNGSTIPCQLITSFIPYTTSVEYDEAKSGDVLKFVAIDDTSAIILPPYISYGTGMVCIAYDRKTHEGTYDDPDTFIWSGSRNQIIVGAFFNEDITKYPDAQSSFYNDNGDGEFIFTSQIRYLGKL